METDVKDGISTLNATLLELRKAIKAAQTEDQAILNCFVLAQTFDNQKRGLMAYYPVEANTEVFDEVKRVEAEANEEYQKLFKIYDRLNDEEIIDMISKELEKLKKDYEQNMEYFGELDEQELIQVLEIRDRIKILFDELEVWENKFVRKDRIELERKNELFQEVKVVDEKLRDELVVKSSLHYVAYEEAKRRLIKKPDGSKRFDFWWWHAGR